MDTDAGQCDWDYLKNLKSPFLLHIKIRSQEKLIISKWDTKHNCLKILDPQNNKWKIKGKKYFDSVWDGIVIYTDKKPLDHIYSKENTVLCLLVVFIALISHIIIRSNDMPSVYILPIVIGLSVSLFTYWRKYISKINIVEQICHRYYITDCDAVENSSYSSFIGLNMIDISLSFFASQLVCTTIFSILDISNILYTIYLISAIVIIPITLYSLYSQIRIGKICPLCIMIIICVFAEVLVFMYMPVRYVKLWEIIIWGIFNIFIIGLLSLYSHLRINKKKQLESDIQFIKLKRKKETILSESLKIELPVSPIWLGEKETSINITTIISPSCNHCRKIVSELLLLKQKGIKFRWNIILGKMRPEDSKNIDIWVREYISDKENFIHNLRLWSSKKIIVLHSKQNIFTQNNTEVSEICSWFEKHIELLKILSFPKIVLNDRMLSNLYTTKDIELIINDLSQ